MFRLAHVTDPHFRGWAGVRPWQFVGKRAVGGLNILVSRRRKHRMELLERLGQDLRARAVDHVAVTGDIGNISLEGEWQAALTWLASYAGTPEACTVIPGNHDTYCEDVVRAGTFERLFARYQSHDGEPHVYPFVRLRGPLALIAINTSVPTGDLGAWGRIGGAQLSRLAQVLADPSLAGRMRVVMMHHPPVVHRPPEDRNLRDRAEFARVLAGAGAHLVLHGHDHRDLRAELEGPGGTKIPVMGAGSASYAGPFDRSARYNVYEFDGGAIAAVTYAYDAALRSFREARRFVVS